MASRRYYTRTERIVQPGAAGILTDVSLQDVPQEGVVFAQDALSPRGRMVQRRGWKYKGDTQVAAKNLVGVYRAKFQKRGVTRTIATTADGFIYIVNDSGAGTSLPPVGVAPPASFIPRCVYMDQLILCDITGTAVSGAFRYSGAGVSAGISAGAPTYTVNEATITGATYSALELGQFFGAQAGALATGFLTTFFMVDAVTSATSFSVSGVKATAGTAVTLNITPAAMGAIVPCASVYNTGTASAAAGTLTGAGTRWISDLSAGSSVFDVILFNDAGTFRPGNFSPSGEATASSNLTATITKTSYDILRPPRFTDVAAHKNSLFGTGVLEFPSRVYVGPPGWNLGVPPGAVLPFDPSIAVTSTNRNFFALATMDVPNSLDNDPVVALLTSPGPLIVLKRGNAYAIDGSYPDFSQRVLAAGAGCIDLRSAISLDEGQFWAGENGIYWYHNGGLQELTRGKINNEWRALTGQGVDYCTMGISFGYLIVSIKTVGATPTTRTWAYHIATGAWETRLSNTNPRHMFTARVAGELEQLFMVQDGNQGRVINFTKALDGTGNARDDDGTSPVMWIRSGSVTSSPGDTEQLSRMVETDFHSNIESIDGSASTADVRILVDEVNGNTPGVWTWNTSTWNGGDSWGPMSGKAAGTISQHTGDGVVRSKFRVGRRGRVHQWEFKKTATSATEQLTELHEIAVTFFDMFRRD